MKGPCGVKTNGNERSRPLLSRSFSIMLMLQTKVSNNVWVWALKYWLPTTNLLSARGCIMERSQYLRVRAGLWPGSRWPPRALFPALPRSQGPRAVMKLEGGRSPTGRFCSQPALQQSRAYLFGHPWGRQACVFHEVLPCLLQTHNDLHDLRTPLYRCFVFFYFSSRQESPWWLRLCF